MKRTLSLVVVMMLFALSAHAQLAPAGPDNAPKVGDIAPDFQVTAGGRGAAVGGGRARTNTDEQGRSRKDREPGGVRP